MDWSRKWAAKADMTRAVDSIIKTLKAVPDATPVISFGGVKFSIGPGPIFFRTICRVVVSEGKILTSCFHLSLCYYEKKKKKMPTCLHALSFFFG